MIFSDSTERNQDAGNGSGRKVQDVITGVVTLKSVFVVHLAYMLLVPVRFTVRNDGW